MAQEPHPAAAAAMTIAVTVPALYTFFLPGLHEVHEHPVDRVRAGQVKGSVVTLVLGAAAAVATRSPWPALAAVAVGGLVVWQYETHRRPSTEEG